MKIYSGWCNIQPLNERSCGTLPQQILLQSHKLRQVQTTIYFRVAWGHKGSQRRSPFVAPRSSEAGGLPPAGGLLAAGASQDSSRDDIDFELSDRVIAARARFPGEVACEQYLTTLTVSRATVYSGNYGDT